jgi:hypothetical protein
MKWVNEEGRAVLEAQNFDLRNTIAQLNDKTETSHLVENEELNLKINKLEQLLEESNYQLTLFQSNKLESESQRNKNLLDIKSVNEEGHAVLEAENFDLRNKIAQLNAKTETSHLVENEELNLKINKLEQLLEESNYQLTLFQSNKLESESSFLQDFITEKESLLAQIRLKESVNTDCEFTIKKLESELVNCRDIESSAYRAKIQIEDLEKIKVELEGELEQISERFKNEFEDISSIKEKHESVLSEIELIRHHQDEKIQKDDAIIKELNLNLNFLKNTLNEKEDAFLSLNAEFESLRSAESDNSHYKYIKNAIEILLNEQSDLESFHLVLEEFDPIIVTNLLKLYHYITELRAEKHLTNTRITDCEKMLQNNVSSKTYINILDDETNFEKELVGLNSQIALLKESYAKEQELSVTLLAEKKSLVMKLDEVRNDQTQNHEFITRIAELELAYKEQKDLTINLSEENGNLETERKNVCDKLNYFKEVVGPKLKFEIENSSQLSQKLALLKIERDELQSHIVQLEEVSKQTEGDSSRITKMDELMDDNEKCRRELDRLRQFLVENEENQNRDAIMLQGSVEEKSQQIKMLENSTEELREVCLQEQKLRKEMEVQYQQAKIDLNEACSESHRLKAKLLSETNTLHNLQKVLEQFQTSIPII